MKTSPNTPRWEEYKQSNPIYAKRYRYLRLVKPDGTYYRRKTRWYWLPIHWFGNKVNRYTKNGGKMSWWIRRNMTYD